MDIEAKPIRLPPVGKFIAIALVIAMALLLLQALGSGSVLSPFVAALITAYLFNPLVTWGHRRTGVSRAAWILLLYALLGTLIYVLVRYLGPMVTRQYRGLLATIPGIQNEIERLFTTNEAITIAGFSIRAADLSVVEKPLLDFVAQVGHSLSEVVPHIVFSALESVVLFVTYLIVTFYLLLQAPQIVEKTYGLVPAPYRAEIRGLGQQIDQILSGYVRGTLLLIPIMSVITFIALSILGVRYALVIAIASGFLEIIPLIGPWTAAGIAMTVSLFQATTPFGWSHALLAGVVGLTYFVLRMFEDNFIIPYVVGHAVKLHPVMVLFAILAGGALGGPFGLLIAIPTVAVVQLLLRYLYAKLVDSPDPLPPAPPPRTQERSRKPLPAAPVKPLNPVPSRPTRQSRSGLRSE